MEAAKPSLTIAPRRSRVAAWLSLRRMDGVLAGAAVGLIAFSVFTLASSTRNEIAGRPFFFVERQGLYAVLGIALMVVVCGLIGFAGCASMQAARCPPARPRS